MLGYHFLFVCFKIFDKNIPRIIKVVLVWVLFCVFAEIISLPGHENGPHCCFGEVGIWAGILLPLQLEGGKEHLSPSGFVTMSFGSCAGCNSSDPQFCQWVYKDGDTYHYWVLMKGIFLHYTELFMESLTKWFPNICEDTKTL